jgi:hypothetical protein
MINKASFGSKYANVPNIGNNNILPIAYTYV